MPCMISWAKHCHVVLQWIGMYWGWSLSHREMRPHSLDGLEDSGLRLHFLNKYTSTGCRSVPFSPSNYTHLHNTMINGFFLSAHAESPLHTRQLTQLTLWKCEGQLKSLKTKKSTRPIPYKMDLLLFQTKVWDLFIALWDVGKTLHFLQDQGRG